MLNICNEKKSIRNAYGNTLVELGKKDENIVVLDADLSCSTQSAIFAKEFPNRFFDCGIAEADMMCTAAGLSLAGKIPFVSTFAMFATARCLDQIRNSICYPNLNVKIIATHGGLTVGEDGATHQALEDVSFMRSLPNMKVIVPADYKEAQEAIKFAHKTEGPFYIRLSRSNVYTIFSDQYEFNINKAVKIKEGKDVTVITNGETLKEVIDIKGPDIEIIHCPSVKPIDKTTIIESAKKTKRVVVVENHSIIGALGSAVCEVLSENYPTPVLRIGTNDVFGQSGTAEELMDFYGLNSKKIETQIGEFLKK